MLEERKNEENLLKQRDEELKQTIYEEMQALKEHYDHIWEHECNDDSESDQDIMSIESDDEEDLDTDEEGKQDQ
jgi:hypothetical protein